MGKQKLLELDSVRGAAIMAVVLIHGTAEGSSAVGGVADVAQAAMLIMNKLCAFAVPAFIFVSGIVLFYGAPDRWDGESLRRYYKRRVQTSLVPYLLWSLIFYSVNQWLAHGADMRFDPVYFGKLLITGGSSYHLYFLVILMQLYAVFPFMAEFVRRYDPRGKMLLAAALLLQLAFYTFSRLVHPVPFSYLWAFGYVSFFALGGWFGLRYAERAQTAQRLAPWLAALALAFGLGYAGLHLSAAQGAALADAWYELSYCGLGLAAAAALVAWARRLHGQLRWLAAFGRVSFGVYLIHPLALSLWRVVMPLELRGWEYSAVNALGIALVVAACWGISLAYYWMKEIRTNVR